MTRILGALWRVARAETESAILDVEEIYRKIFRWVVIGSAVGTLVMLCLNAVGWKEVNFIFVYAGLLGLAFLLFAPRAVLIAFGLGAGVAGLKDEDLTQGSVNGVKTYIREYVLGILLWYVIVSSLLATVSFQAKPLVFFPIVTMSLILALMVAHFGLKGRWMRIMFITLYAVGVISYNAWQIVPEEWKSRINPPTAPAKQGQVEKKLAELPVKWATLSPDGTVPVDVWSESSAVPTYCDVRFPGGYGTVYVAQSQHYSTKWTDIESGKHYEMDKFRLKVLAPGIVPSTLVYTLSCR